MFGWIPFVISAVVLLWAVVSFRFAADGGQHAGLHEMLLPTGSSAANEPANARGGRGSAVLLTLVVLVVAAALLAYAVLAY